MKTRRVTRYITDCGRGFWNKRQAETHETNCKCWTNPKNKTCKTCIYGMKMPDEPDVGVTSYWECNNEDISIDGHTGGPDGVDYLSVNCRWHKPTSRHA